MTSIEFSIQLWYIFFLRSPLIYETNLNKKTNQSISYVLSDHNGIKVEIRKKLQKHYKDIDTEQSNSDLHQ